MGNSLKKLRQLQIQENLESYMPLLAKSAPRNGWIRLIRSALGIQTSILAKKLNCSAANVSLLEKSEKAKTISLNKLDEIAQALNCKLVYSIIPMEPIDQMLVKQANKIAKKQIRAINHSMALEQQGLNDKQVKLQEKLLAEELLQGNLKKLWVD